jgi:hypothetical protein
VRKPNQRSFPAKSSGAVPPFVTAEAQARNFFVVISGTNLSQPSNLEFIASLHLGGEL